MECSCQCPFINLSVAAFVVQIWGGIFSRSAGKETLWPLTENYLPAPCIVSYSQLADCCPICALVSQVVLLASDHVKNSNMDSVFVCVHVWFVKVLLSCFCILCRNNNHGSWLRFLFFKKFTCVCVSVSACTGECVVVCACGCVYGSQKVSSSITLCLFLLGRIFSCVWD